MSESLEVTAGGPGLRALIARAVGLDASASARFRVLKGDAGDGELIDVFVTTPFDVVACRRVKGTVSRDGAVVAASALLHCLETGKPTLAQPAICPGQVRCHRLRDFTWWITYRCMWCVNSPIRDAILPGNFLDPWARRRV